MLYISAPSILGVAVDTSTSLLGACAAGPDPTGWGELVNLYTPLIRTWLGRHFLQAADADDLTQQVLTVVVRKLASFQHNGRPGAFRAWLRGITVNTLRSFRRSRPKQWRMLDSTTYSTDCKTPPAS